MFISVCKSKMNFISKDHKYRCQNGCDYKEIIEAVVQ